MIPDDLWVAYDGYNCMLTGICGRGVYRTPSRHDPIQSAYERSPQSPITSESHATAFWDGLFGQRLGIGLPRSTRYFGLGNQTASDSQRTYGSRWVTDDMRMENKRTTICGGPSKWFLFLSTFYSSFRPVTHELHSDLWILITMITIEVFLQLLNVHYYCHIHLHCINKQQNNRKIMLISLWVFRERQRHGHEKNTAWKWFDSFRNDK